MMFLMVVWFHRPIPDGAGMPSRSKEMRTERTDTPSAAERNILRTTSISGSDTSRALPSSLAR
jgi:hypothetical protein